MREEKRRNGRENREYYYEMRTEGKRKKTLLKKWNKIRTRAKEVGVAYSDVRLRGVLIDWISWAGRRDQKKREQRISFGCESMAVAKTASRSRVHCGADAVIARVCRAHSWYHFLSFDFCINSWAFEANFSASVIMRCVRSSSWLNFSPRSTVSWWARDTSLVACCARWPSCSIWPDGPGMCLATLRTGLPLVSPTATCH